jgi:hypothetical protein
MSTIRFRELVKVAGAPEPKTLWTDPKNDRDFMRAVKQNRVLTVVQESRKKDFGELGFHRGEGALYFVFPKPLPEGKGRVIGIKYDLAESSEPKDPVSPEALKRGSKRTKARQAEKKPVELKTYHVLVRRVAILETKLLVEAKSKTAAREKCAAMVENQPFDVENAKIKNEIESVK